MPRAIHEKTACCKFCHEWFTPKGLKEHLRHVKCSDASTATQRVYQAAVCKYCNGKFHSNNALRVHVAGMHPEEYAKHPNQVAPHRAVFKDTTAENATDIRTKRATFPERVDAAGEVARIHPNPIQNQSPTSSKCQLYAPAPQQPQLDLPASHQCVTSTNLPVGGEVSRLLSDGANGASSSLVQQNAVPCASQTEEHETASTCESQTPDASVKNTKRKRITMFQMKTAGARYGWRCAMCEQPLREDFQVDHDPPLFKRRQLGLPVNNDIEFLQPLCYLCHLKKNRYEQRKS